MCRTGAWIVVMALLRPALRIADKALPNSLKAKMECFGER